MANKMMMMMMMMNALNINSCHSPKSSYNQPT